ncbi:hypothetical protein GH714_020494 [Hevea brasiliensis]|uniref:1-aminocyclopropane-1-carboxylate synthase n=1 Tax=Hevea brasiliensis TaxID=3981 RepID=A0A6A6KQ86_HEVBR|nr:hypothetical protein GH714_020494 [Hevea brasiliensis]
MVSGQLLSRIATNEGHGENSPYFDGWKEYDGNPFHPTDNPDGVIQMGLAENQLSFDLITDWIKQNPEASICTAEGVDKFKDIANFQDYHGLREFREAIAKFMGMVRGGKVTFDPDRVVMGGGATGANELIMFCLADPGDAFLVPSPYYPAFDRDLTWRTGVQIIPVDCYSSNNFQVTKDALESAYDKAQDAGINVKGLIIANPSNPLGTILDRETLKDLVSFINERNIHLVADEIYAATIFSSPSFISVAEIIQEMDCNRDLIHIVYSLSKDMGLPGFRVGIVYSYNDAVVNCGRRMSSFGGNGSVEGDYLPSEAQCFAGSSFHCKEPGWFRVCFANMDDETVEAALKRIRAFVCKGKEDQEMPTKSSKRWQKISDSASQLEDLKKESCCHPT